MPPDASAAPIAPALCVQALSHRFAAQGVLHDVSFTVPRGSFTVLLGPNGAGKTTLFALATRLYNASAGHITVCGHDVQAQPLAALAALGVVFQQQTLDLDLTTDQNLAYHAGLHGLSRRVAAPRIQAELTRAGLIDRRHAPVRSLSGGQRRRVELARAMLHAPTMLLLDEPTVGLDMQSRHMLRAHVHALCQTTGLGVLWATHLIDEADAAAQVIILHDGRVLACGEPAAIVAQTGAADLAGAFAHLTRRDPA